MKKLLEKYLSINKKILALAGIFFVPAIHALDLPKDFLFGVANAPAHVEDQLDDPWIDFARRGRTKAFNNHHIPKDRLRFWSEPEVEVQLAKELGVNVFRLGIDWQRLVPLKSKKITNKAALKKYKKILKLIRSKKMKVMLTLFHHSLPEWAIKMGGWTNPDLVEYFVKFSADVIDSLSAEVDYLITFNEPNVYSMFSYVTGLWPPGIENKMSALNLYNGDFYKAQDNMSKAHNLIYKQTKRKQLDLKISVAQNVANYKSLNWYHFINAWWANQYMNYYFLDQVSENLDFLGFNYYGAEYLNFNGPAFKNGIQYSDSGRAIDFNGFKEKIEDLYFRYGLDLFVTENGVADSSDYLRSYYIFKHLKVIESSLKSNIPIIGYIHWTLTDNFEWSDGYCPKFGLVKVDRKDNLKRTKRESFYLYKDIIKGQKVSESKVYEKYQSNDGKIREMCRAANGIDALNEPIKKIFKSL